MATTEERLTLPPGHPEAGYVGNDPSLRDGAGTLPPDEQDAYDEMVQAHKDEVEAVAKHEDEVAQKQRKAELAATETDKTTTSKSSSSSGTSSSS